MNKKTIISILVIVVLLVVVFVFMDRKVPKDPANFADHMRGQITEIKDGYVTVKGVAQSIDNSSELDRTVVFQITTQTIFKQQVLAPPTMEQIKSGKPYKPTIEDRPGAVSDLNNKTIIISIVGNKNLFTNDKAKATEIYYLGQTPILPQ